MVKDSIQRSRPCGTDAWVRRTARALDLTHTLRPRGRPEGWRKQREMEEKSE